MNKQITFRAVLGVALLSACASIEAKPPTCTQPLGKWNDEVKSVIEIKTYDTATGAISGEYTSHSGASASSMPYPAVNDMPPPRATTVLTDAETRKLESELVAARNRAAEAAAKPAEDADKP